MTISATIVADSINEQKDRLTTIEVVMPRIVLSEFNTHRILSKNSASSRAIPFKRMLKMVDDNPFIPIAFQKEHTGMQGTEYFTDPIEIQVRKTAWLESSYNAMMAAITLNKLGVTKQMVNRLLEPFMWHKVIVTATEWRNFFELRSPLYFGVHRSKKDALSTMLPNAKESWDRATNIDWLKINKAQAEIHMQAVTEAIWDAMNESTPKRLSAGQWHIPYGDKIDMTKLPYNEDTRAFANQWYGPALKVPISTAMCARVSYTVVGDEKELSYKRLIGIHDRIKEARPFHASPFEHCSQTMSQEEYQSFYKSVLKDDKEIKELGWCKNYKGFKQYRYLVEENI